MLTCVFPIQDSSHVGEARRSILAECRAGGFDEPALGRVAIVINELGSNLLKHAGRGELLFQLVGTGDTYAGELWALDAGPGMADVEKCLTDGYSTAGSPGTGLGAVVRQSQLFDIYSIPRQGTVIYTRLAASQPSRSASHTAFMMSGICTAMGSEPVSGDDWTGSIGEDVTAVALADGLGHGLHAHEAAAEAMRVFHAHPFEKPVELVQRMHLALRSTRGAAVGVAQVRIAQKLVEFAGAGNLSFTLAGRNGALKRMVSMNGTAGLEIRKLQAFQYPWEIGSLLIGHSDGVTTSWMLEKYPGILERHPGILVGVLFRDYQRGTDDVCIVVLREAVS